MAIPTGVEEHDLPAAEGAPARLPPPEVVRGDPGAHPGRAHGGEAGHVDHSGRPHEIRKGDLPLCSPSGPAWGSPESVGGMIVAGSFIETLPPRLSDGPSFIG